VREAPPAGLRRVATQRNSRFRAFAIRPRFW
jgi:hypothetical protein